MPIFLHFFTFVLKTTLSIPILLQHVLHTKSGTPHRLVVDVYYGDW